jgi:phosphoglycerol geranylgeranyltransferase
MKVYDYLLEKIKKDGAIHMTLIDPDEQDAEKAAELAKSAQRAGTDAIYVGGSGVDQIATDECVKAVKKNVKIPVILFPGNISGISRYADAIFFMSLLNSRSRYWLSFAQAFGAFAVKKCKIEPIPMGYLVFESKVKTSVEFYGDVNVIPQNKPKIAAAFALAAQYMGMKFVYLEGGSGAPEPINDETILTVRKAVDIPIIVGGGIRDGKVAYEKVKAGADAIGTGTVVEEAQNAEKTLSDIVKGVKKAGKEK